MQEIYIERAAQANARISLLRALLTEKLSKIPTSDQHPTLCIYATGSLARKEASEHSDLDAFFMLSGNCTDKPIGRIRDVKILNSVLDAADEAGFPDFSGDGEYLRFLHVDDVVRHIGGREDDYVNAFTARMLLLLESVCIFNEDNYVRFQNDIIDVYFNDFHKHAEEFKPIFLINDVLRFWRTLCLNYESARHWRSSDDEPTRAKGHLDNLKLKFSRLNICYSFICHLLSQGMPLSRQNVLATCALSPFERLAEIEKIDNFSAELVQSMREQYAWFLNSTNLPKSESLLWISDENVRIDAFSKASNFVENTVKLVTHIANKHGYLRYLIV